MLESFIFRHIIRHLENVDLVMCAFVRRLINVGSIEPTFAIFAIFAMKRYDHIW